MSDNETPELTNEDMDLKQLKERADLLGVGYSNNIKADTLAKRIQDHMDGVKEDEPEEKAANQVLVGGTKTKAQLKAEAAEKAYQDANRLIRLRITNLDPKKAARTGEVITVANDQVGTFKKFIPFGERTDNGWHVPYFIYEFLKERQFLQVKVVRTPNGRERVEKQWVREFALEVLPPLTKDELKELAAAQAASGIMNS